MGERHQVTLQPSGRRGEIEAGKTLLEAAQSLGIEIRSDCGGRGTCGKCRIEVLEGGQTLDPPTAFEESVLGERLRAGYRLACRTSLRAPLLLMIPEESRIERVVILTDAQTRSVELDPTVKKYHLRIDAPTLADPLGDVERLLQALEETYDLSGVAIAYPVLRMLPRTLREANWDVTVTVCSWGQSSIIHIEPGYVEECYGVAFDIGTTTIVGYLAELTSGRVVAVESMTNPQVAFGEDVLSRISYTMQGKRQRRRAHEVIVQGLKQIIREACKSAAVDLTQVVEMTAVGNTAMHHFLLDLEVEYLAKTPFPPVIHSHYDLQAREVGLEINPAGHLHVLPVEAGFVGADNVAALIATELFNEKDVTLLIDIGTNGELVLGNRSLGLVACSVAAGPAFEGACIRYGMRASTGAIEHLKIDPRTFEVECAIIGAVPAREICGSGIIDTVAEMLQTGVIDPEGRMNSSLPSPRMRSGEKGAEFVLQWGERTAGGEDIVITQHDIRSVQLAKGAFYAGAQILMKHLGVVQLEKVLLAGAFGSYLDPRQALAIGLFPPCDPQNVLAVGNAAGYGALMALINRRKRTEAIKIVRGVRYIELTAESEFQSRFIAGTNFPEQDLGSTPLK